MWDEIKEIFDTSGWRCHDDKYGTYFGQGPKNEWLIYMFKGPLFLGINFRCVTNLTIYKKVPPVLTTSTYHIPAIETTNKEPCISEKDVQDIKQKLEASIMYNKQYKIEMKKFDLNKDFEE